jgi:DNA polymerase-3 subunit delta
MSPARSAAPSRVYLIHSEDPGLVSQELATVLEALSGLDEPGLGVLEEYGAPGREETLEVGAVLNACRTPPFLSNVRIVVVRDVGAFDAASQRELVAYLNEPLETTILVLVANGRPPAALLKAVQSHGTVIAAAPPANARARAQWVSERVRAAPVALDGPATALLSVHLGEDLARLDGILSSLEAAYGPDMRISEDELEPFLGEAGGVAPFDLTDAIDAGDGGAALVALHRLLDAGERAPLQILAILHRNYAAMLRLDGAGITDEAGAQAATGMAGFPARKALTQTRRLGHDKIVRAIALLADADLDLRGKIGWPPALVMEVLVARLAQLARSSAAAGRPRAR